MVKLSVFFFAVFFTCVSYSAELLVSAGVGATIISQDTGNVTDGDAAGYSLGVMVYRPIKNTKSSMGTGIDVFSASNLSALGFRAVDYKYAFSENFSINTFVGAVRVDSGAPQVGYYFGLGATTETKFKHLSIGVELLYGSGLQRDIIPSDAETSSELPDIFLEFLNSHLVVKYRF